MLKYKWSYFSLLIPKKNQKTQPQYQPFSIKITKFCLYTKTSLGLYLNKSTH